MVDDRLVCPYPALSTGPHGSQPGEKGRLPDDPVLQGVGGLDLDRGDRFLCRGEAGWGRPAEKSTTKTALPASVSILGRQYVDVAMRAVLGDVADGKRPFDSGDVSLPVLNGNSQLALGQLGGWLRERQLPDAGCRLATRGWPGGWFRSRRRRCRRPARPLPGDLPAGGTEGAVGALGIS